MAAIPQGFIVPGCFRRTAPRRQPEGRTRGGKMVSIERAKIFARWIVLGPAAVVATYATFFITTLVNPDFSKG